MAIVCIFSMVKSTSKGFPRFEGLGPHQFKRSLKVLPILLSNLPDRLRRDGAESLKERHFCQL